VSQGETHEREESKWEWLAVLPATFRTTNRSKFDPGATSEYAATHAVLKSTAPEVRGLQSRSQWKTNELSVELKCYHGPQSRSRWIRNEVSVELKCYRGLQSRSRWIRNEVSVELKCYRGQRSRSGRKKEVYSWFFIYSCYVNYHNCGTVVAAFENTHLVARYSEV